MGDYGPMKYTQGDSVLVENFDGSRVPLRVWQDLGDLVLVTSECLFELLKRGESELYPIGVPKADVFALAKSSR